VRATFELAKRREPPTVEVLESAVGTAVKSATDVPGVRETIASFLAEWQI